jgi:hypothetical protein
MDVALEMLYRVEGKPGCSPTCEARHRLGYEVLHVDDSQAEFWDAFPRGVSEYNKAPLHGEIRMRIGQEFLRQYTLSPHPGVLHSVLAETRHVN